MPANTTTYTDAGRQPGTYYDYHIQAANLGGYTDFAGFSVTTITDPPANITATGGNQQINLDWSPSFGSDSYNVYRGTSPAAEGPTPIAIGVVTNSYVDAMVSDGLTYYYTVTAVTTGGESAASSEVHAMSSSNVVIQGTDGDDAIYLVRDGDALNVYINIVPVGEPSQQVVLPNTGTLTIGTGTGNDTLFVDTGGESSLGIGQLIYNSVQVANTLSLAGGSARIDSTTAGGTLDTTVQAVVQLSTSRLDSKPA